MWYKTGTILGLCSTSQAFLVSEPVMAWIIKCLQKRLYLRFAPPPTEQQYSEAGPWKAGPWGAGPWEAGPWEGFGSQGF